MHMLKETKEPKETKRTRALRMGDAAWSRMLELAREGGYRGRAAWIEAMVREADDGNSD